MANPATRLITLILLLQRKPNQKAADLASSLGVSVRTLHRYITMLGEMGIPIYSERGPYGGFSLVRGYKLPPLVFSPEEAVALYLGTSLVGEMWGRLYEGAAQGAMAKLDNVLPDEQRTEVAWAQRTMVATGMNRADPSTVSMVLEKIRRGARSYRRIMMTYQSSTSQLPTQREVDPYSRVRRSGWWYLVGYCHLREDLRTFRVDRIQQIELTNETFQVPEAFNIHAYLAETFAEQPVIKASLRFLPQGAYLAMANLAGWESHRRNEDGSVDVTLSAPDLPWLASLVLGYGTWVKVIEPRALRIMVQDWARKIADQYSDEPTPL